MDALSQGKTPDATGNQITECSDRCGAAYGLTRRRHKRPLPVLIRCHKEAWCPSGDSKAYPGGLCQAQIGCILCCCEDQEVRHPQWPRNVHKVSQMIPVGLLNKAMHGQQGGEEALILPL